MPQIYNIAPCTAKSWRQGALRDKRNTPNLCSLVCGRIPSSPTVVWSPIFCRGGYQPPAVSVGRANKKASLVQREVPRHEAEGLSGINCLFQKTIPQSPAVTAPFTQGSLGNAAVLCENFGKPSPPSEREVARRSRDGRSLRNPIFCR